MVQQLLQEQLTCPLKKTAEGQYGGQKSVQLLQGEPTLLVSVGLRSFHLCTVHTVENHVKMELCSAVAAVYLVYLGVFPTGVSSNRHTSEYV